MCLQAGGACLVSQPGHMLSICVCGLAEGRPRARCYVSALVGRGRRIVPILLFWSASFPSSSHLVGAQPTAEVKEWIARTTVLHPVGWTQRGFGNHCTLLTQEKEGAQKNRSKHCLGSTYLRPKSFQMVKPFNVT